MNDKSTYQVLVDADDMTVLSSYEPVPQGSSAYQGEAALEARLIQILGTQGIDYLPISSEDELLANIRLCMDALNGITLSDREWKTFLNEYLARATEGVAEKAGKFQRNPRYSLRRDDGTTKNLDIVDKRNVNRNKVQVINQYVPGGGTFANRYDVTILVNGLPLVHIELKKRGGSIREAFNQIDRYGRESFWAGSALFEWVQVFVISNGTLTKYYANTTRAKHVRAQAAMSPAQRRRQSGTFEYTNWWADAKNHVIADLEDFARTFLAKRTLLNILCRYCVSTEAGDLMVMRPYQIAATERVLQRVLIGESNKKLLGTLAAGGYVWHTTGSGKTLTSFKCAQLASQMEGVDQVLFVVDRKDLDYQTMREYEKFQKGAVNGSKSAAVLERNLSNPEMRIHVMTIQKLDSLLRKHAKHDVYDQHVVIIFDECHRSQFGDMHKAITRRFKHYHLFGFTGTPIFPANAGSGKYADLRTTEQAFGDCLHQYTIVDAIRDENVLPFRVGYVNTVRRKEGATDAEVEGIDTEEALLDDKRITNVATYVLDHFDQATKRTKGSYVLMYEYSEGESRKTRSADSFDNYYKDLSMRMKSLDVDLLVVVNMFLTGFDAPCLNTLWVDKRLKMHGLIQSFSRTNRILNSIKSFGNIVCFRNLEERVDEALALFGDKEAAGVVVLKPYREWLADYADAVDELHGMLQPGEQPLGESAERKFIRLWGLILRLRNILAAFDEFQGNDLLSARAVQDYQSVYNYLYEKYRKNSKAKLESIVDDLEFEMELVKQVEVGIDYILMLVAKYHESNCEDKEIRADIDRAIDSSPTLRDKRDLIERFIEGVNVTGVSHEAWAAYVAEQRDSELSSLIREEKLDEQKTKAILRRAWGEGYVRETGTAIADALPKGGGGSMFSSKPTGMAATLERVIEKLKSFFERFHEIAPAPGE